MVTCIHPLDCLIFLYCFGTCVFGGTNFHVVMEEYTGRSMPEHPTLTPPAPQPARTAPTPSPQAPIAPSLETEEAPSFPEGVWATSALTREDLLRQLETLRSGGTAPWHPSAPIRIAAAARDEEVVRARGRAVI